MDLEVRLGLFLIVQGSSRRLVRKRTIAIINKDLINQRPPR